MNRKQMLKFLLLNSDTVGGTLKGVPPLTYNAKKAGFLTNYRIYGQTVDGESVGDRTGNLFDMKKFAETCSQIYATVNYINNTLTFTATNVDAYVNTAYNKGATIYVSERQSCIDVLPSTTYTISMSSAPKCFISWVNSSYEVVRVYAIIPANQSSYTFTTPEDCTKILIRLGKQVENIGDTFVISNIMLNEGVTPLPYEPYGYKVPVTVERKNLLDYDTVIYLPEQIRKVGDETEYIDYREQKMYRIGVDDLDVTLPTLPTLTGTNVLSVGTEVQP